MAKVALITVTHDPNGENQQLFKDLHKQIEAMYEVLYITVSDQTNEEMVNTIKASSFQMKRIPKKGAANARREGVKFALEGDSTHFHYCDLDRLLTWVKYYPEELSHVIKEIPNHSYYVLGRTEKAFATHPKEWVETEKITNHIFSLECGQSMDITAGSCAFTRGIAKNICKYSNAPMTDAEWAMIAYRVAKYPLSYRAVEGLEYHQKINGIQRVIPESEKWMGRLKLSHIISETAIKTGK